MQQPIHPAQQRDNNSSVVLTTKPNQRAPHFSLARLWSMSVVAVLWTSSCASVPPAPPAADSASVVGVRVTIVPPIGLFSMDSESVFFVRADVGDPTRQNDVLRSNYHDGDYVYLLNAQPGTYAVVAATHSGQYGETFTTYLPEDVIQRSTVTVGRAAVAFMGEFEVKASLGLGEMDAAQRHYNGVIQPGEKGGFSLFSTTYIYRGSLREADQSPEAWERFHTTAKGELGEHGWAAQLAGS